MRNEVTEETRLSVSGVLSVRSQRLVAPCSQTLQNLSGIQRGAPAGTLHPARQGKHRGFMSTVPCMDLRIFQNTSPSPRPPVRLKPEPHLPPLNPAASTLPGIFFNPRPPSSLDLLGLAWPRDAPSLSHQKGSCRLQGTGRALT